MIPPYLIWSRKHRNKRWPGAGVPDLVRVAYKKGHLTLRPCVICGSNYRVNGHHPDYAKPLHVIFLCQRHHMRFHYVLEKRFWLSSSQRYTQQLHDQVLRIIEREFLEPELSLFSQPRPAIIPPHERKKTARNLDGRFVTPSERHILEQQPNIITFTIPENGAFRDLPPAIRAGRSGGQPQRNEQNFTW